ncbi:hypothetical protein F2Q69_00015820 [Brassica cretica]|uniref:Uncharacterized protein n=1 Tax=Brassica cretica TaxID=69181 RepID=A0A8S9R5T1_BRACR|nr:hypothetical protein F2Q69_00015820 [Brassica cretica]
MFHIARRSSFHVDRFSHLTVNRHPTFIVERSSSFDIDRYYTVYIHRSSVAKHGCDCYSQIGREWKPHEKFGEGDFEVESSMSFGGSLLCRPMSMDAHRSTDHDEDRSTDYSNHRSTSSAKLTAECSAIRIMTHEEFAEKHPHPPSPFYVKIDRRHEPAVDRQRETDIDRPPSPPIDRRAPLTYRVL